MTIAATLLCIISFLYSMREIKKSPIVKGVVVKSELNSNGKHTPIIEYNSPTKETKWFRSRLSTSPQFYFVGDTVEVILAGDDYEPKLKNFFNIYGLSAFLLLFATISAIGSIIIYRTRVKQPLM